MPEKKANASAFSNKWFVATVVLVFLLALSVSGVLSKSSTGDAIAGETEMKARMESFIRQNLVQEGVSATIKQVSFESGVYKFAITLEGGGQKQEVTSYATPDGKLFFAQGINVPENVSITTPTIPTPAENNPKSDKPTVDLYVMSFCPYGVQAENAMKPVVDVLGEKMDMNVRFITNIGGTTPESVGSLHGAPEAQEDLRQACVMKNYDSATYWKYVSDINANCFSIYRDPAKMDTCWKDAAKKSGIDRVKIAACANSTEAVNILKADEVLAAQNNVRGSPTLIINGKVYSGARSPDAFKEAICSAFTTTPAECGAAVNATVPENTEQHSCG